MGSGERRIAIAVSVAIAFAMGLAIDGILDASVLSNETATVEASAASLERETVSATQVIAWWTRFAALMSVFTAVAAIFAFRAYREGRRSADAAIESNAIARDAAERQLRAYISIENTSVEVDERDRIIAIKWDLVNRGATPARDVTVVRAVNFGAETPNKSRLFSDEIRGSKFDVSPGQKIQSACRYTLDEVEPFDRLMSGEWYISFGVWGSYRDAFGKRRLFAIRTGVVPRKLVSENVTRLTVAKGKAGW